MKTTNNAAAIEMPWIAVKFLGEDAARALYESAFEAMLPLGETFAAEIAMGVVFDAAAATDAYQTWDDAVNAHFRKHSSRLKCGLWQGKP